MIFESPYLGFTAAAGTLMLGLRFVGQHDGANTPWDRRIGGIGWVALSMWLAVQAITSFAPVVDQVTAPVVSRGDGVAIFSVAARKIVGRSRDECVYEYTRAYVADAEGAEQPAFWERMNDPAPGQSRGPGMQSMGLWRIRFSESDDFRPVTARFESFHNCGMLWGRPTTRSGPFSLAQR